MEKFCATFYTHYGAIKFNKQCKNRDLESKIAPVPRKISASCTTCVFFEAEADAAFFEEVSKAEDLESCYLVNADDYQRVCKGN